MITYVPALFSIIKRDNLSEKVVRVEEELGGIGN